MTFVNFSGKHNITSTDPLVLLPALYPLVNLALPARLSHFRRIHHHMDLSIDAIIAVADGMKEDLQCRANQGILRNDMNRALGALASIKAIDDFVYSLKIRAGSQLGLPTKRLPKKLPAVRRIDTRFKAKA